MKERQLEMRKFGSQQCITQPAYEVMFTSLLNLITPCYTINCLSLLKGKINIGSSCLSVHHGDQIRDCFVHNVTLCQQRVLINRNDTFQGRHFVSSSLADNSFMDVTQLALT